jgi:hypothetical protein
MGMIGVTIYGIGFTFVIGNNATHYFFQFISEFFLYKVSPAFYREHVLGV